MITRNRIWGFLSLAAICLVCIVAFAHVLAQHTTVAQQVADSGSVTSILPGLTVSGQLILLAAVIIVLLIFLSEFISKFIQAKKEKSLLELELEKKNEKLKSAVAVLAVKNEELEKFNYILAHDLKEPVRIINAYSGLVMQKAGANKELSKYAKQVVNSSQKLNKLIHEAGAYMDIEVEDLEVEDVNSAVLMIEVENNLSDVIQGNNASIIKHDLPQLTTHRDSLKFILTSLIKNGLVYNESLHPQIIVYYKSTKNYHCFYVSDNGIGVQEEYKEQIFEMFQRLHTKDAFPGTGLGLSACRKLAKAMDGKIVLHKSGSQGSTFLLKFRKVRVENEVESEKALLS